MKDDSKIKGIYLVEVDHNTDCKIAGIGAMQLNFAFVKKARVPAPLGFVV